MGKILNIKTIGKIEIKEGVNSYSVIKDGKVFIVNKNNKTRDAFRDGDSMVFEDAINNIINRKQNRAERRANYKRWKKQYGKNIPKMSSKVLNDSKSTNDEIIEEAKNNMHKAIEHNKSITDDGVEIKN